MFQSVSIRGAFRSGEFLVPYARTLTYRKFFFPDNIRTWNPLPQNDVSFRYFTTKYLSHRSTCYLRAKFLPYKARFEYQKWVHFEESSSHKKEMCRNYSVRVPFPFRILDVNKLIKKPAENQIHKFKIDHV